MQSSLKNNDLDARLRATPDFWQSLARYRDCLREVKNLVDWAQKEDIGRIAELHHRLAHLRTALDSHRVQGGHVGGMAAALIASLNTRFGEDVLMARKIPLAAAALDTRFSHALTEEQRERATLVLQEWAHLVFTPTPEEALLLMQGVTALLSRVRAAAQPPHTAFQTTTAAFYIQLSTATSGIVFLHALLPLVRMVFSVPVSSAASERVFSTAGEQTFFCLHFFFFLRDSFS